jgi:hypothetical protein
VEAAVEGLFTKLESTVVSTRGVQKFLGVVGLSLQRQAHGELHRLSAVADISMLCILPYQPQQRDGAVRHALGVVGINRRPLRTFELPTTPSAWRTAPSLCCG